MITEKIRDSTTDRRPKKGNSNETDTFKNIEQLRSIKLSTSPSSPGGLNGKVCFVICGLISAKPLCLKHTK